MTWRKPRSNAAASTLPARWTERTGNPSTGRKQCCPRRSTMSSVARLRKALLCTTAAVLCLAGIVNPARSAAQSQAQTQDKNQDQEVQMGQEVFNQLKAKGEIIESSPLYD